MCCNKTKISVISKNPTSFKFLLLDNKYILQIINTIIFITPS